MMAAPTCTTCGSLDVSIRSITDEGPFAIRFGRLAIPPRAVARVFRLQGWCHPHGHDWVRHELLPLPVEDAA